MGEAFEGFEGRQGSVFSGVCSSRCVRLAHPAGFSLMPLVLAFYRDTVVLLRIVELKCSPNFGKYARRGVFIGTKRKIKRNLECLALCGFIFVFICLTLCR